MPDETGALIAGSAQIASTALTNAYQAQDSNKGRKWASEMYDKQRKDALADRDFTLNYALPQNIMARYKAAGLNPNLIYGQGNNGGDTSVRSSSFPTPVMPHRSAAGYGEAVGTYFNVKLQQQQLDNMEAQTHLIDAQTNNQNAQADAARANVGLRGSQQSLNEWQLGFNQDTADLKKAVMQGTVDKLVAGVDFTKQENARQWISSGLNIAETAKKMALQDSEKETNQAKKAEILTRIKVYDQQMTRVQQDIDYINTHGNEGRPGDNWQAKIATWLYGKIVGKSGSEETKTVPSSDGTPVPNQQPQSNIDKMKNADWRQYIKP